MMLPHLKRALQEEAAVQDRTMGYLIEKAVQEYLAARTPKNPSTPAP
jgi:predicted transcriptional regulator